MFYIKPLYVASCDNIKLKLYLNNCVIPNHVIIPDKISGGLIQIYISQNTLESKLYATCIYMYNVYGYCTAVCMYSKGNTKCRYCFEVCTMNI